MTPADNIALIRELYTAFRRNDLPGILATMTDDVDWGVEAEASSEVPWHRTGKGKNFAAGFFEPLATHCVFTRFETADFLASESGVAVLVTLELRLKKNDRVGLFNIVHHFTIVDGKVAKWRGTEDTALTKALWNS